MVLTTYEARVCIFLTRGYARQLWIHSFEGCLVGQGAFGPQASVSSYSVVVFQQRFLCVVAMEREVMCSVRMGESGTEGNARKDFSVLTSFYLRCLQACSTGSTT